MTLKQLFDTKTLLTALLAGLFGVLGSSIIFVFRESVRNELQKDAEKDARLVSEILGRAKMSDDLLRDQQKVSADLLNKIYENRSRAAENAGAIEALARDKLNEVASALASNNGFVNLTSERVTIASTHRLEALEGRTTKLEERPRIVAAGRVTIKCGGVQYGTNTLEPPFPIKNSDRFHIMLTPIINRIHNYVFIPSYYIDSVNNKIIIQVNSINDKAPDNPGIVEVEWTVIEREHIEVKNSTDGTGK